MAFNPALLNAADDAIFAYSRVQRGMASEDDPNRVRPNRNPFGRPSPMLDSYHGRGPSSLQGLFHGWYGAQRGSFVPFGSGWKATMTDQRISSTLMEKASEQLSTVALKQTSTTQASAVANPSNVSRLERETTSLANSRKLKNFFRFK